MSRDINPFSHLIETRKFPFSRFLRTSFIEKLLDLTYTIKGSIEFIDLDNQAKFGIYDYLTLGIPRFITNCFLKFFRKLDDYYNRSHGIKGLAIGIIWLISGIIFVPYYFTVELLPSALLTLINIPLVLIAHLISKLFSRQFFKKLPFDKKLFPEGFHYNPKKLVLDASFIPTDDCKPAPVFENFRLTFVFSNFSYTHLILRQKKTYCISEIRSLEIEELEFLLTLLKLDIGGISSHLKQENKLKNTLHIINTCIEFKRTLDSQTLIRNEVLPLEISDLVMKELGGDFTRDTPKETAYYPRLVSSQDIDNAFSKHPAIKTKENLNLLTHNTEHATSIVNVLFLCRHIINDQIRQLLTKNAQYAPYIERALSNLDRRKQIDKTKVKSIMENTPQIMKILETLRKANEALFTTENYLLLLKNTSYLNHILASLYPLPESLTDESFKQIVKKCRDKLSPQDALAPPEEPSVRNSPISRSPSPDSATRNSANELATATP